MVNYKNIINGVKDIILRKEVCSNEEEISLYDLVNILKERISKINEIVYDKNILDRINEDINMINSFNTASNNIERYYLGGSYKLNNYIDSKLGDGFGSKCFNFIDINYKDDTFYLELLLSEYGKGSGITVSKDSDGMFLFDGNSRYKDIDIDVVKKEWEYFLKVFSLLEDNKLLFSSNDNDLLQVVNDNELDFTIEIDRNIVKDSSGIRVKCFCNLSEDKCAVEDKYYYINHCFKDMFSSSRDAILKRISIKISDLNPVFKSIVEDEIKYRKDNNSLKKEIKNTN